MSEFNAETWPLDQKAIDLGRGERFLCTPDRPKPKGAPGRWSHTGAVDDGECSEGCCDDYKCTDCGETWRIEAAQ